MEISNLQKKLNEGKFVITSEIGPGKGTNLEFLKEAEVIKNMVDAINVTDLQSSVMRLGSLSVCHLLVEMGIEPIFQITCRDRNRLALQSDLLNAYVLGIRNVLVLTGDHPILGDHPEAKSVFDLDSVSLLKVASTLMEGKDMKGNELDGKVEFFIGAVVSPGYEPIDLQIIKMEKKIENGAKFFQTQAVYDLKKFEEFMKRVEKYKVPILGGIVLLKSAGMAKYMNENVAGVTVPDKYIEMMAKAKKEERVKVSLQIGAELIKGMKDMCQGIHIMPLGWDKYVPDLLSLSGII
ncbi:MAG TPA: methylenetetrahydrofolate reductase [bacterium]|mgnify:CR=1 FL=1|nr:methylenetetrahydrofolate reductase [bacterium]HOM27686.1 methylenetetrahydrofolate reductase [bacterium]